MADKGYDIEIEDTDGIGAHQQKNSFRALVMEQYKRVCTEGAKEMTTGGVMTRIVDGERIEHIVPNQIEIFNNSVELLMILLFPQIESEAGKFALEVNAFNKNLKKLNDKMKKIYERMENNYNQSIKKINPNDMDDKEQVFKDYTILKQQYKNKYELRKHALYKDLLGTLSLLLGEINYLEEQSFTG